MKPVQVRIRGTINDVVEIEVADDQSDEEAIALAMDAWRYVEYEDLAGELIQ